MCETECEYTSLSDDYTAPTVIHSQFVHLLGKLGLYERTCAGPGLSYEIATQANYSCHVRSSNGNVTCTQLLNKLHAQLLKKCIL